MRACRKRLLFTLATSSCVRLIYAAGKTQVAMPFAFDWVRDSLRSTDHKFNYWLNPSAKARSYLQRDEFFRGFNDLDWTYDFGYHLSVGACASNRVYKGLDRGTKKTVWAKVMTNGPGGFDDACNMYLLGCPYKGTNPCGPPVLGIYQLANGNVVVVSEDATDTVNRVYAALNLTPRLEIADSKFAKYFDAEEEKYTHERRTQLALFDAVAYSRCYVKRFTDRHYGNLLNYNNLETNAIRFLQIDIESSGPSGTIMDDQKGELLKTGCSVNIQIKIEPTDTILTLKSQLEPILKRLPLPPGYGVQDHPYSARNLTLRTAHDGMETADDDMVLAPLLGGKCYLRAAFVLTLAGTAVNWRVCACTESQTIRENSRSPRIDPELRSNFNMFKELYGHLFPFGQLPAPPFSFYLSTNQPKVSDLVRSRERQTAQGVSDHSQIEAHLSAYGGEAESVRVLLAAGYPQEAIEGCNILKKDIEKASAALAENPGILKE